MNPVVLTAAPSITDWITAISTAVLALSVLGAALGWTRRQAKQLRNPGEAPGGQEGEDREFFEDVLRPIQGGSPPWWKDQQRGRTWLERWQRRLRGRERRKRAEQRAERLRGLDEEDEDEE